MSTSTRSEVQTLQLRVVHGDAVPSLRTFEGSQVVVGRPRRADVRIDGGPVSRRHLVFLHDGSAWTVRNGGRLMETLRNGRPFDYQTTEPVRTGDVFVIGRWRIVVTLVDGAGLAAWLTAEAGRRTSAGLCLRADRRNRPSEWFPATGHRLVVGRSQGADFVFDGYRVSRTHAVLAWGGASWTVTHAGRLLPTYVNAAGLAPKASREIAHGDAIVVGGARLVASLGGRLPKLRWDEPLPEDDAPSPRRDDTVDIDAGHVAPARRNAAKDYPDTDIEKRPAGRADDTDEPAVNLDDTQESPATRAQTKTRKGKSGRAGGASGEKADPTLELFTNASVPVLVPTDSGDSRAPVAPSASSFPSTLWETRRRIGAGARPAAPSNVRVTLREGAVVEGRFRVERRERSDRPAAAWRATDLEAGGPAFVYEVLLWDPQESETRGRFVSDLRAAAQAQHDGLERVLAVREAEDRVLVVADAPPATVLTEEIARRARESASFAQAEVVRVARSVADALRSASRTIFHARLSPGFVGLTPAGGVRIAALGWREVLVAWDPGAAARFEAPEIGQGRADWRADQYSLAMVLRDLLGGASPEKPGPWSAFLARATAAAPDARFPSWDAFEQGLPA